MASPTADQIANLTNEETDMVADTDVLGHIRRENAKRDAQAKAEGWTFWTNMAEAIASDYANVYELELMFARGAYADSHKDWCGRKGYVSDELTLEQVEAEVAKMAAEAEAAWIADQEYKAEMAKQEREAIALGLNPDTMWLDEEEVVLEEWEVYEAKAEEVGHGA